MADNSTAQLIDPFDDPDFSLQFASQPKIEGLATAEPASGGLVDPFDDPNFALKQATQPRSPSTQEPPNFAELEGVTGGFDDVAQIFRGAEKGVSHLAGKYGSMLAGSPDEVSQEQFAGVMIPTTGVGMGTIQPGSAYDITTKREDRARLISAGVEDILGIKPSGEPQNLGQKILAGIGQGAATLPEYMAVGRALGPVFEGAGKIPELYESMGSPLMARIVSALGPSARAATTFGSAGGMEAEQPGRHVLSGAAAGALLGPITEQLSVFPSKIPAEFQSAFRVPLAGAVGAGQEYLTNPNAKAEDIIASATLTGGFSAMGGPKENWEIGKTPIDEILNTGIAKGIQPRKKAIGDNAETYERFYSRSRDAIKDIIQTGREGDLNLVDKKGNPRRLPENVLDQLKAIDDTLAAKARKEAVDVESMTGKQATISVDVPIQALKNFIAEKSALSSREAATATREAKKQIRLLENRKDADGNPKPYYTVEEAIAEIKGLNNNTNLTNFMRQAFPNAESLVAVDGVFADGMRRGLGEVSNDLVGPGFRQNRQAMRDLITLREETSHRAAVVARKATKGIWDISDPWAVGHIVGSLAMAPSNPAGAFAMFLKGATVKGVSKMYKNLTHPDYIIKDMYRKADAHLGARPEPEPVVPSQEPPLIEPETPKTPMEYVQHRTASEYVPSGGSPIPAEAYAPAEVRGPGPKIHYRVVGPSESKVPIWLPENPNPSPVSSPADYVTRTLERIPAESYGPQETVGPGPREHFRLVGPSESKVPIIQVVPREPAPVSSEYASGYDWRTQKERPLMDILKQQILGK